MIETTEYDDRIRELREAGASLRQGTRAGAPRTGRVARPGPREALNIYPKEIEMSEITLETTLTHHDAWGKPRTVTVEWMPEDITMLVDPARLNTRNPGRLFAHNTADDPPVRLERSVVTGSVKLQAVQRSWAGEYAHVTEFGRVQAREDLEPGTYFIASDSDA